MKHHLVIFSILFYLGGTTVVHAAQIMCPSDSGIVSVLLAKEKGDKKEGEEKNPEDDCE